MSLRTKLLAATIGLPVAVVLLCLWLVQRADRQVYTTAESIGNLVTSSRYLSWREFGRTVEDAVARGDFRGAWVLHKARTDTDESEDEYWTAARFYADDTTRLTSPDIDSSPQGPHRELVRRIKDRVDALGEDEPWVLRSGDLVIWPADPSRGRTMGVVLEMRDRRGLTQQLYGVMLAGALVVAFIGWWLVTWRVVKPVERLAASADQLARGARPDPLQGETRRDEIGVTVAAFNRMAKEIHAYRQDLEGRVLAGLERIERTEHHLLIAQRLAATGKLAAGLAHEINNPLGGMRNALASLARGDLPPDRQTLYLGLVADGLGRIESLVRSFLAFSPRATRAGPADLVDAVERSLLMARHRLDAAEVVVETQLPAHGDAIVFGDAAELQQATLNLLLNAADALARVPKPRRLRVSVARSSNEILLEVADNGPGIAKEDQDRCFDMFFTTKDVGEGSGLGLAIVHALVTNHGGSIQLASAPGQGAAFRVFFPEHHPGATPVPAS